MLCSMTGFGRACKTTDKWQINLEMRSVNSRYLESSVRLPQNHFYLEPHIKKRLRENINRGKVDVFLSLTSLGNQKGSISLNETLLEDYISSVRAVSEKYSLPDDLKLHHIINIPDLFSAKEEAPDEEEMWELISPILDEAMNSFLQSRLKEGERLQKDIFAKLSEISEITDRLCEQTPKTVVAYRERLTEQLKDILKDRTIDESRILTEAAVFADKIAIDEELVRLKSHIAQFYELLEQKEPVGRKCDFLLQEMNREANTVGSKGNDIEVSKMVVELKSVLEKIRQQIQNIE